MTGKEDMMRQDIPQFNTNPIEFWLGLLTNLHNLVVHIAIANLEAARDKGGNILEVFRKRSQSRKSDTR